MKVSEKGPYDNLLTDNCERVLVTLLGGLGPWGKSVCLVGGLTPRYLVPILKEGKKTHIGTGDVDLVVHLEMLADTDAYQSLEDSLKRMGFKQYVNEKGNNVNWRWWLKTDEGVTVYVEFLADFEGVGASKSKPLPTEGRVTAVKIPHAAMVFDHHLIEEISAKSLDGKGISAQEVRFADIVSFTALKAFACEQRQEAKDPYDLVFCLENFKGGVEAIVELFQKAREGKYRDVIEEVLKILRRQFASDKHGDGFKKTGTIRAVELEGIDDENDRVLRQRQVSEFMETFLKKMG